MVISIVNDKKLDIKFKFIHPLYEDYQRLYFSEDLKFMVERLANQRDFYYQRKDIEGDLCEWTLVRRLIRLPMLENKSNTGKFFTASPDL